MVSSCGSSEPETEELGTGTQTPAQQQQQETSGGIPQPPALPE